MYITAVTYIGMENLSMEAQGHYNATQNKVLSSTAFVCHHTIRKDALTTVNRQSRHVEQREVDSATRLVPALVDNGIKIGVWQEGTPTACQVGGKTMTANTSYGYGN